MSRLVLAITIITSGTIAMIAAVWALVRRTDDEPISWDAEELPENWGEGLHHPNLAQAKEQGNAR